MNIETSTPPESKKTCRWQLYLLKAGRVVLFSYLGIVLVLMFLENSMVYVPARYPEGDWEPHGFPREEVCFESKDGTALYGWYIPHEEPIATVLFCYGNGGNLTFRQDMIRTLHNEVGVNLMLFDYRGYGKSEGKISEQGFYQDARAARKWLAERTQTPEKQIVLFGRSLGGAVATELATTDGTPALILESTFTSLPDVAATIFPWLPVHWLMRNQYRSKEKIPNYQGPVLYSHGDQDDLIPLSMGEELYETIPGEKKFYLVKGGDHNTLPPEEYYQQMREFLREHVPILKEETP
ncbi:Phospholipase/carboxylesterase [Planctomycetales bacterium 10988]|nr:Phospholipase/carboxylesterase [Planctomycetales bacterium 10988]